MKSIQPPQNQKIKTRTVKEAGVKRLYIASSSSKAKILRQINSELTSSSGVQDVRVRLRTCLHATGTHNSTDTKCRLCDQNIETIDRLITITSIHKPNVYKNSHDWVSHYLHWEICHYYRIKTIANGYESSYIPLSILITLKVQKK